MSNQAKNIQVSSYANEIFNYLATSGTQPEVYSRVEVNVKNLNDPNKDDSFTIENAFSVKSKVDVLICDLTDDSFELKTDQLNKKIKHEDDTFQIDFIVMKDKNTPVSKFGIKVLDKFVENKDFCVIVKSQDKDSIRGILETIVYRPEFLNNSMFVHSVPFPRIHFFDLIFKLEDIDSQFTTAVSFGIDEIVPLHKKSFFQGPESITKHRARVHWLVGQGMDETTILENAKTNGPKWKKILEIPGKFPKNFALVGNGFVASQFSDDGSNSSGNLADLVVEYNQYLGKEEEEEEEEEAN